MHVFGKKTEMEKYFFQLKLKVFFGSKPDSFASKIKLVTLGIEFLALRNCYLNLCLRICFRIMDRNFF